MSALRRVIVLACYSACLVNGSLTAAGDDDDEPKRKQTVAMSQAVFTTLQEAQKLVHDEQYDAAHAILEERLKDSDDQSPYEKAQLENLNAYIYYLQERYADAVKSYENVLAQDDIPEAIVRSTLQTLSQLYFTMENYAQALAMAQRLLRVVNEPDDAIHLLIGQSHFQLGQYREALDPIKKVIALNRERGIQPEENWLLLLRVIHYELQDYPAMLPVLTELTQLYPKDEYLLALAGIHSELGDTASQLALLEPLYEKGYLDRGAHVGNLASLYLLHGLPYKAARVMEQAIQSGDWPADESNLTLLAQAWYQAREDEKAIPVLTQAAQLSDRGELYMRLAQSHINLEQWTEAADALNKARKKGGLKRIDQTDVMLGVVLFNQKDLQRAREAFSRARQDKRSAKAANQWIRYIDNEIRLERSVTEP